MSVRKKKKRQNRLGLLLITVMVFILVVVIEIGGSTVKKKLSANQARIDSLNAAIVAEKERSEEIEEFARYSKTKAYYEEMARKKLGLVYADEILFKSVGNQ